jgi:hypothetical protein
MVFSKNALLAIIPMRYKFDFVGGTVLGNYLLNVAYMRIEGRILNFKNQEYKYQKLLPGSILLLL